jgi:hypothetical protein
MVTGRERTPREQDTLIFPNSEKAEGFAHEVRDHLQREQIVKGVDKRREKMAEQIEEEFARAGEPVEKMREPWPHTEEEHQEAQKLVDLAFAKDLSAALRQARNSPHYPRNLDLFHDVLTGEMYNLLNESKLNRQPVAGWIIMMGGVLVGIGLAILVVLA